MGYILEIYRHTNVDNLRPICSCCNKTIGTKNMDDFISQYITSIPTQIQEVKYGYVGELNLYMRENVSMMNIIYKKLLRII